MVALCMIWGMQQVAAKAVAADMNPILQIGLRSALAALMVYALIRWRGERLSLRDGTLAAGLGVGLLFGTEFLAIAAGLQFTSASHMSVFLYTAPIFTNLGLHWLVAGERMSKAQWAGVLAAFAGIAVAFSGGLAEAGRAGSEMLLGDALAILAGLLWGATTVLIRYSALSEAPSTTTLLYQLGGAGIIILGVAIALGQPAAATMTPMVWSSLFFQTVIVGFVSYLVWFGMLRRYLASRLSAFTFLTPLFGVAFGVLLLDESLSIEFCAGAVLVCAGVLMVNLRRR